MSDVFPGMLEQWGFVDDSYSRRELERKDRAELQKLAANHPDADGVNGQSSNEDIIDGLVGEKRL